MVSCQFFPAGPKREVLAWETRKKWGFKFAKSIPFFRMPLAEAPEGAEPVDDIVRIRLNPTGSEGGRE